MSMQASITLKQVLIDALEVPPGLNLRQARQLSGGKRALVVVDAGRVTGIAVPDLLSNRDLLQDEPLEQHYATDFLLMSSDVLGQDIGNILPGLARELVVVTGENGQVAGVLSPWSFCRYLHEKKQFLEARLDAVLDAVVEAVCIIDDKDLVVAWNKRAETLYGIKAQDILGQKVDRFFSNIVVTRVIKQRKEVRSTYHQPCRDTHVLINASPVKINDKIVGGVSAERDITEVVQLNQELSKASSQVKLLEEELSKMTSGHNPFSRIRGHNKIFRDVVAMAGRVAATDAAVLLRGETGTGKEMLARAIHEASPRSDKPFRVVNCRAVDIDSFESLYADNFLSRVTGGTLFLEEVSELSIDAQAILVHLLQNKTLYSSGEPDPGQADIRIISATHRDLEAMLEQNLFREDLYYQLNVVTLELPPLKNRLEDIPELAYQFLQEFCGVYNKIIKKIEPVVMAALLNYSWPGNIQELRNTIQRMVVLVEGEKLTEKYIPSGITIHTVRKKQPESSTLSTVTEQTERELILSMLTETAGNRSEAARRLGIPRSTLYYKMHQLGLL